MSATARTSPARTAPASSPRSPIFASLAGVIAVVVLFQAAWAGMFIREGKEYDATWVTVHARGADLAIVLALVAVVIAFVKLRARKDLLIGSIALLVVLVLESYIGGLVGENAAVTALHFPLGMALMGLCVWLPLRSRHSASQPRVARPAE